MASRSFPNSLLPPEEPAKPADESVWDAMPNRGYFRGRPGPGAPKRSERKAKAIKIIRDKLLRETEGGDSRFEQAIDYLLTEPDRGELRETLKWLSSYVMVPQAQRIKHSGKIEGGENPIGGIMERALLALLAKGDGVVDTEVVQQGAITSGNGASADAAIDLDAEGDDGDGDDEGDDDGDD